jgi:hypothetical protein
VVARESPRVTGIVVSAAVLLGGVLLFLFIAMRS